MDCGHAEESCGGEDSVTMLGSLTFSVRDGPDVRRLSDEGQHNLIPVDGVHIPVRSRVTTYDCLDKKLRIQSAFSDISILFLCSILSCTEICFQEIETRTPLETANNTGT